MRESKCNNCVKASVCELRRKLYDVESTHKLDFSKKIYDTIKQTYITTSDYGFDYEVKLSTRDCKHYLAIKEDYIDEKAKKEKEVLATKEKLAMTLFEALVIERGNKKRDFNIFISIDEYSSEDKENRLQTFYAVCDKLYETFGAAKAEYDVYSDGTIGHIQFDFTVNNFTVRVDFRPNNRMDYHDTMKEIKKYADIVIKRE